MSFKAFAIALLLVTTTPALAEVCLPPLPNAAFLKSQEQAGGHLIDRHVGKSDDALKARLKRDRNLIAASSFPDIEKARSAIATAVKTAAPAINTWADQAKAKRRTSITVSMGQDIGRVAYRFRGDDNTEIRVKTSQHIRLVIQKQGPDRCLLLTGYPALVLDAQALLN